MIGQILDNRYELLEFIGKGGMALVYRALDHRTGHSVAVKILRPEYSGDKEFVERFDREATAASKMSHHNIVNLLDVGISGNMHYLVMEYVLGKTLKEVIDERAPFTEEIAAQICVRILSALQHAHKNKIIHRDIKPQNVLVHSEGHIKVSDFGIARLADSNTVAKQDSVMGSAHYISPEQAKGEDVTFASDIYSVGVVLYEMLTGRVPFDGDNPVAIALQHVHIDATPVRELKPEISPLMESIVRKAMEKDVRNRYQSAVDMARDLHKIIGTAKNEDDTGDIAVIPSTAKKVTTQRKKTKTESANKSDKKIDYAKVFITLACIVVTMAIAVVAIGMIIDNLSDIEVPYVIGCSEEEAQRRIEGKGLRYILETRMVDEKYPAGYVCGISPSTGTSMNKGESVYVIVSTGGKIQKVPDFSNMTREKAIETGDKFGFNIVFDEAKRRSPQAYDTVVEQSVPAGEELENNSVIRLTMSGGEAVVPNLVGMKRNEALAELKNLGIRGNVEIKDIITTRTNEDEYDRINDQQFQTHSNPPTSFNVGDAVMLDVDVILYRYVEPGDTEE